MLLIKFSDLIFKKVYFSHIWLLIWQSEHFPFLGTHTTRAYKDMRSRTTFYIALGRLLMVDLGEDEEKFESFMAPITSKYTSWCYSQGGGGGGGGSGDQAWWWLA